MQKKRAAVTSIFVYICLILMKSVPFSPQMLCRYGCACECKFQLDSPLDQSVVLCIGSVHREKVLTSYWTAAFCTARCVAQGNSARDFSPGLYAVMVMHRSMACIKVANSYNAPLLESTCFPIVILETYFPRVSWRFLRKKYFPKVSLESVRNYRFP